MRKSIQKDPALSPLQKASKRSGHVSARIILAFVCALLSVVTLANAKVRASDETLIFAAASLIDVLGEVGTNFDNEFGGKTRFSFAASSVLARQIGHGAPANLFISAHEDWANLAQQKRNLDPGQRINLASNRLVIVAQRDDEREPQKDAFDLNDLLNGGKIALADPGHVPAGLYAKAALTNAGLWSQVQQSVIPARNVRIALSYVSRGDVKSGIVYRSDALSDPSVKILMEIDEALHPEIVYPAFLLTRNDPRARKFMTYLQGKKANSIFLRAGFTLE